ncbi:hypothetical protein GCM10028814_01310 [Angustibacter aerolatus]
MTRATTRITTDVGRRAALARLLAALGAVVALVVTTAGPASAATPSCFANGGPVMVGVGCEANATSGHDRAVVRCQATGSSVTVDLRTGWRDRYADWGQWVNRGYGWTVRSVWFERAAS